MVIFGSDDNGLKTCQILKRYMRAIRLDHGSTFETTWQRVTELNSNLPYCPSKLQDEPTALSDPDMIEILDGILPTEYHEKLGERSHDIFNETIALTVSVLRSAEPAIIRSAKTE